MAKIFKYTIAKLPFRKVTLKLPKGVQIFGTRVQEDSLCIWAIVNPDNPITEEINYELYRTGDDVVSNKDLYFVATVEHDGSIYHIFKRID